MTAHHRVFEVVSVGYERRSIEEFVEMLSANRVDVLVDVRLNPISRKRGFSKTALTKASVKSGSLIATNDRWATPRRTAILSALAFSRPGIGMCSISRMGHPRHTGVSSTLPEIRG